MELHDFQIPSAALIAQATTRACAYLE